MAAFLSSALVLTATTAENQNALSLSSKAVPKPPQWKCMNTPGWKASGMEDEHPEGIGCEDYKRMDWCTGDGFNPGYEWTGGANHNYPEANCCACITESQVNSTVPDADIPYREDEKTHNPAFAGKSWFDKHQTPEKRAESKAGMKAAAEASREGKNASEISEAEALAEARVRDSWNETNSTKITKRTESKAERRAKTSTAPVP